MEKDIASKGAGPSISKLTPGDAIEVNGGRTALTCGDSAAEEQRLLRSFWKAWPPKADRHHKTPGSLAMFSPHGPRYDRDA